MLVWELELGDQEAMLSGRHGRRWRFVQALFLGLSHLVSVNQLKTKPQNA